MNYKTTDFNTAVILHSGGSKLVGTEKDRNGQVKFHFKNDDLLQNILEERISGGLSINPEKIFYSERFLRTIIKEAIINY